MGRKKTPRALRIVKSDREQGDDGFDLPPDMPECPAFLHPYAKEEWLKITPTLYSLGILTFLDGAAVAGYCQAFARWRFAEERLAIEAAKDLEGGAIVDTTENGNKIQSVFFNVAAAAMRDMLKFAAEFGMTPSARARIEGKRGEAADPISTKFFKKG